MRKRKDKRVIYIIYGAFVVAAFAAFLTQQMKSGDQTVRAASLEGFDAGKIISDYQMGNYQSMTEEEIQSFLTTKNACKNTNKELYEEMTTRYVRYSWHFEDGHFVCLSEEKFGDGEVIGEGETAAHIIWRAAQDYKINPQVLIVLLQKEQGLITDTYPNNIQYRSATGYGCPDTAACSSKYYGFKNQVRNAAAMFRTVLDGGWTNYKLGKNYIQYNPNPDCGGSVVEIKNLATSALYRYTPYQPNEAALAAGYGTATCGAYGNRNFYLYFEDWFGGILKEEPEAKKNVGTKSATEQAETRPTAETTRSAEPTRSAELAEPEEPVELVEPVGAQSTTEPEAVEEPEARGEYSGTYTIISALDSNKVLDISGGAESAKNGTNIQLWERNGTKAQEWELVYNSSDKTYTLVNPYTGKTLDVKDASVKNGANVQLLATNEKCGQRWKVEKEGNYYWFVSACSEKVLDVKNAGIVNGTNIQIWEKNGNTAQKWRLEKIEILEGTYTIISALDSNKVLDISGGAESAKNGTNIQLWERNGTKAQEWELVYNSSDKTYTLVNPYTGKTLDVSCAGTVNGTNIQLWEKHETCAQRWKIREENGYYVLTSACSARVLDVSAAKTANGTNIQLWEANGTKAQKWKLVKK